jgi:glutamate-ammonia-ligase adenylyltransferase
MNESPNSLFSIAFESWCEDWQQLKLTDGDTAFNAWHANALYNAKLKNLLQQVVNHSPFLAKLALQFPDIIYHFDSKGAAATWLDLLKIAHENIGKCASPLELMKLLRQLKSRAALTIGLADIGGEWSLTEVTKALSELAELATESAICLLLRIAHTRGEIVLPHPDTPTRNSGIIVLGMGKLGAFELNYSSDIDLIIFFEKNRLNYQGKQSEQKFFSKLAQELVNMLHERTADGYVFRTDLRLRPDPASTPLAVSVDAAMAYYEGVGQNWERAAMIKARPIAGDIQAGEALIRQLVPFVWRKSLDFATIQDILSIKRQISHKIGSDIKIAKHNIKLGHGGIREIEFFVQLHQLIWGGRQQELRSRATLETLRTLVKLNHVPEETAKFLEDSYIFLRTLEHRLQMVNDQQTHSMPENEEDIATIATFMGRENADTFKAELSTILTKVHAIFVSSFNSEGLAADEGNLVFTGTNHDPATLETLRSMGFQAPEVVSETVMGWHHGSRRCTRTKRSRQILTELVPAILDALSETANPDNAFLRFDTFLNDLPAGVQIFSLFSSNPHLLTLIADIMGSAPALSQTLSRQPELLESVLFGDFYHSLPTTDMLSVQLNDILKYLDFFDAGMEALRQFKHEKQFQAGVQMLQSLATTEQVASYLSCLADILVNAALELTQREFRNQYGVIEGAVFCIIALGKLGSEELTFGSDIDLIFIYDVPDFETLSDGKQAHSASVYFNRFAQRLLNAFSTTGSNGLLFEVDTRLRPSGKQGLLAVSKQAFTHYFNELAWTFEYMALVKARVVAGDAALCKAMTTQIDSILRRERNISQLKKDAGEMRARIEQEFPPDNMWDVKHVAGGLMDSDFVAQTLVLAHAHDHPELLMRSSSKIFEIAKRLDLYDNALDVFAENSRYLARLQHILRLTSEELSLLENPPAGLAELLAHFMGAQNYEEMKNRLHTLEVATRKAYMDFMSPV